ncbi:hypothetical protein [Dyadobacter sp. CY323]|uniref:hypothetical protein n=1 Tax=Dyadobacter sp. CY323 TaxID=2907302 RepID=UPI001F1E6ABF|nr:hypothetical protein [Dyadobacter sp. CY323]MCE6990902.1 hypothetical protein [Dyadobacter sp. CY323]
MKIYIVNLLKNTRKWLRRLVISYMLGFASAIDQDTKSIDDTFFKIEQTIPDKKG